MKLQTLSKFAFTAMIGLSASGAFAQSTDKPKKSEKISQTYEELIPVPVLLDCQKVKTFDEMQSCIENYLAENHKGKIPVVYRFRVSNNKFVLRMRTVSDVKEVNLDEEPIEIDITNMVNRLLKDGDEETKKKTKAYIDGMTGGTYEYKK